MLATFDDEELLTRKEIANRAKVSQRTVDNWIRREMIPSLKIGSSRRFLWSEVLPALFEAGSTDDTEST